MSSHIEDSTGPDPVLDDDTVGGQRRQQPDRLGLWCTADGHVRQELRADGRYVEARGAREAAYTGRYEIDGDRIEYWDDSGFTADGVFVAGVLHHAGMVMRRR
ncbi:Atu4866 domain-containing protein [Actinotalea subterranea]|uniref:Atu4866 domain-containing protein n=1 Tax=Actinotalea subterranea TaxID=2607497 RepID=UPI0011EBE630|nr:Atu4866 domain-containing protein [Actinotalea subterranea]